MGEKLYSTGDIAEELKLSLNIVCYRVRELVRQNQIQPVIKTAAQSLYGKEILALVRDYDSKPEDKPLDP